MLPSKGFFLNVPCPANEDGNCTRPYCHFFHKFKSSTVGTAKAAAAAAASLVDQQNWKHNIIVAPPVVPTPCSAAIVGVPVFAPAPTPVPAPIPVPHSAATVGASVYALVPPPSYHSAATLGAPVYALAPTPAPTPIPAPSTSAAVSAAAVSAPVFQSTVPSSTPVYVSTSAVGAPLHGSALALTSAPSLSVASAKNSLPERSHQELYNNEVGAANDSPVSSSAKAVLSQEDEGDFDDTIDDQLQIDEGAASPHEHDQHDDTGHEDHPQSEDKSSGKAHDYEESESSCDHGERNELSGEKCEDGKVLETDSVDDADENKIDGVTNSPRTTQTSTVTLQKPPIQSELLQRLVSEAVKKLIAETPQLAKVDPSVIISSIDTSAIAKSIGIVETSGGLSKGSGDGAAGEGTIGDDAVGGVNDVGVIMSPRKRLYPDYKPTPISELKRRRSQDCPKEARAAKRYKETRNSNEQQQQAMNSPALSKTSAEESEFTDFSSADEDDKISSEFDMLEEIIAEDSQSKLGKHNNKEMKKRKKALGKMRNVYRPSPVTNNDALISDAQDQETTFIVPEKVDKSEKLDKPDKTHCTDNSEKDSTFVPPFCTSLNSSNADSCSTSLVSNDSTEKKIGERMNDEKTSSPKPHMLVPSVSQLARKPWTPGANKVKKAIELSKIDMLEAVLEVLDGSSTLSEKEPMKIPIVAEKYSPTVYKADLSKEIASLTIVDIQTSHKEDDSSGNVDDSNVKELNDKQDTNDLVIDKNEESDKNVTNENVNKSDSAGESEEEEEERGHDDTASESDVKRKRSRSYDRSKERHRKRRKRKVKKMKRRQSRSRKRKRKKSLSESDFESASSSDAEKERTEDDNDNDKDGNDENVDNTETGAIKKEDTKDMDDGDNIDSDTEKKSKKKNNRQDESDDNVERKRKRRRTSRKRKRSKHKHRGKTKHRKRRYRSSTSYDSSSSSSSDGGRSRKRRRKAVDLSIVKQEELDVIDLTVIKDETESDDEETKPAKHDATSTPNKVKKQDCAADKQRTSKEETSVEMPKLIFQETKSKTQSQNYCADNSTECKNDNFEKKSIEQKVPKLESKQDTEQKSNSSKERTTSIDSNQSSIPPPDSEGQHEEEYDEDKEEEHEEEDDKQDDEKAQHNDDQEDEDDYDNGDDLSPEFPPSPAASTNLGSSVSIDSAMLYSSKTSTLTEISVFDSLLMGSASTSTIKTIKKKSTMEELSSSSLTPSIDDDLVNSGDTSITCSNTKSSSSSSTMLSHHTTSKSKSKHETRTSSSKHSSKSSSSSSHSSTSKGSSSSSSKHSDSKSATSSTGSSHKIPSSSHKDSDKTKSDHKKSSNSSTSSSHSGSKSSHKSSSDKIHSSDKSKHSHSGSSRSNKSSGSSSNKKTSSTSNKSGIASQQKDQSHNSRKSTSEMDKKAGKSSSRSERRTSSGSSSHSNSHGSGGSSTKSKSKNATLSTSRESEGISDREAFNFNALYSSGCDSEGGGGGDGGASPLPDLSALDSIPEEDWDQLMAAADSEHGDDGGAVDDDNDLFLHPLPASITYQRVKASSSSAVGAEEDDDEVVVQGQGRRVARPGATGNLLRRPSSALLPSRRHTPEQVMMERYAKLKAEQEELQRVVTVQQRQLNQQRSSMTGGSLARGQHMHGGVDVKGAGAKDGRQAGAMYPLGGGSSGSKKARVGGVGNVSALLKARDKLNAAAAAAAAAVAGCRPTASGASTSTMSKSKHSSAAASLSTPTLVSAGGVKIERVAHVPKVDMVTRPVIKTEFGAKVPHNIRQRYLNSFIDESMKFETSQTTCFKICMSEEKVCYKRASSRSVYLSLVVNTLKRLRTGAVSQQAKDLMILEPEPVAAVPALPAPVKPRVQSHFSSLAGGGQRGSWSIEKTNKTDIKKAILSLKGAKLYKFVKRYLLTVEQLEQNCFPRPHPDVKGRAVVKVESRKRVSPSPSERYCTRCGVLFLVDKWGFPKVVTNCVHHWGRAQKRRGATGLESRYICCSGDLESEGCCLASTHVSDNYRPDELTGFVRTLPREPDNTGNFGVYALDCEMSYTTGGCELTRVTVIDTDNATVYETFVQPENPVIDYNTRFSGITAADLDGERTTIQDVQTALLCRFSSSTVLIGHSLESDLMALKIVHDTVVDTSVMFPHKMGAPFKRALRNLASDHLKKIIQNDVSGHDSKEDAVTCMDLLHWKIKEDLRTLPPM